jgi:precorrin isomerase
VALTAAVTKFTAGAWIVVVLIPLIVLFCRGVQRHYAHAREALTSQPSRELVAAGAAPTAPPRVAAAAERHDVPAEISHLVVVPVAMLDWLGCARWLMRHRYACRCSHCPLRKPSGG